MKQSTLITKFSKSIQNRRAAAFLGAGLSSSAGYVDWKGLLKDIACELQLDIEKEDDLISLAQYYISNKKSKKSLVQKIVDSISEKKEPTISHEILASMPLDTYWTTNYDDLIEKSLYEHEKRIDIKRSDKDLLYPVKGSDAVVYKMHGDITSSSDVVISKDDYELYQETHGSMLNVLKGDLTTKSFLFLGYKFGDPDLIDLLSRIRCMVGEEKQEHFAIIREVKKGKYSRKKEFAYIRRKRELQNEDLKRYGIEVVEVKEFSDIPLILRKIAIQVNKENIFISSAIADSQKENLDYKLLRLLVKSILSISNESKVISGYGLNVGPIIVDEVIQYLKTNKNGRRFEEKVRLYPFAVGQPEDWNHYRKLMLSNAGVFIMLYGTKDKDGFVVNSNGMEEEFTIARERGALIIPIGITGGTSAEVAHRLIGENYHSDDLAFLLKENNPQKLVEKVIHMIRENIENIEEV